MPFLRRFVLRLAAPVLVVVGLPGWPLSAAATVAFTPHRAVYELTLDKSRGNGSISRAQGKLEFEWADICTGWTVSQRTLVQLISSEGDVIDFGWTLNSMETKDGTYYRYFIRRLNAGGPEEDQRGEARLTAPGQGGVAEYTEPAPQQVNLPKGTLFPTAHSLLLLDIAESATFPIWRLVFDGSGESGLYGVNAALSQALPAGSATRFTSPLLKDQKSWRLHLAFFGMDETVAVPEHEQVLRMYSNGVVDEMLLDYGDFTLRADLQALESLPDPKC
jgi:hypothetical protein